MTKQKKKKKKNSMLLIELNAIFTNWYAHNIICNGQIRKMQNVTIVLSIYTITLHYNAKFIYYYSLL